jgi:hypothetical protein
VSLNSTLEYGKDGSRLEPDLSVSVLLDRTLDGRFGDPYAHRGHENREYERNRHSSIRQTRLEVRGNLIPDCRETARTNLNLRFGSGSANLSRSAEHRPHRPSRCATLDSQRPEKLHGRGVPRRGSFDEALALHRHLSARPANGHSWAMSQR